MISFHAFLPVFYYLHDGVWCKAGALLSPSIVSALGPLDSHTRWYNLSNIKQGRLPFLQYEQLQKVQTTATTRRRRRQH
ncbi:hypothetical protein TcWFU_003459 [Taenia crassiceps]|uniref:Secreted protein n=1 Tax=Taenia crassiceps TaxID=6207 RepID=A0ABR4QQT7_9CEST